MRTEDEPYTLSSVAKRQRRTAMLSQSHIEPLQKYLANIKAEHPHLTEEWMYRKFTKSMQNYTPNEQSRKNMIVSETH